VSFTGAIATAAVHSFTQALTASLSFTGAQSRRVGKGIAATVSFTGAQAKSTAVKQVRDGVVHRGADAAG
jgi:hypothetical protein